MVRPGFEPWISDSKGGEVASRDTLLQIPTVVLPSLTTSAVDWDKYKEYLYANQRPNTARLALKYGKKLDIFEYSYRLDSFIVQPDDSHLSPEKLITEIVV